MNPRVHTMHYAANLGFGRMHCRKCGGETLHKMAKCIHCDTAHATPVPVNLSTVERRAQINVRNYQVAQARKTGLLRMSKGG